MYDVVPPSEFVMWIQCPPVSSPSTVRLTWTSVTESPPSGPCEFCAETAWYPMKAAARSSRARGGDE